MAKNRKIKNRRNSRNRSNKRGKVSQKQSIKSEVNPFFNQFLQILIPLLSPLIGVLAISIRESLSLRLLIFMALLFVSSFIFYLYVYKQNIARRKYGVSTLVFVFISLSIFTLCLYFPVNDGCLQGQILSEDGNMVSTTIMAIPEDPDVTGKGTKTDHSGRFLIKGLKRCMHTIFAYVADGNSLNYAKYFMPAANQSEPSKNYFKPFWQCKFYKLSTIHFENDSASLNPAAKLKIIK